MTIALFFFVSFCITLAFFAAVFVTILKWNDHPAFLNFFLIIVCLLVAVIIYAIWQEMYQGYAYPICNVRTSYHA